MSKTENIKKNYLYNLVYTLLNTALPLLTMPYLSRVVGAEGVGIHAYYYSTAHIFYIIARLGLTNYGTRLISRNRDNDNLSDVFSSIYYQQVITALAANVAYWAYYFLVARYQPNGVFAVYLSIWVFAGFFDIDWLFSGLEQFKSISRKNILVKTISVALIFILVKRREDLWKYTLLIACSMFFGYLSMWLQLKKLVRFVKVPIRDVLKHLKPNLLLVIPVFAVNIYRTMDKIMLGSLSTMIQTGLYENAEKIVYALCGFITAFGSVMMPRITHMIATGQEAEMERYRALSMEFMMTLMIAMAAGIMAVSDRLALVLFGQQFAGSGPLLGALAVTLPIIGWANVIRSQYVIPRGLDRLYVITVVSGAVVNLIVNALLIPRMDAMGAVIGTICAEGIVPVIQFLLLRRQIDYVPLVKKSIIALVSGIIMYAVVRLAGRLPLTGVTMLGAQILLGVITYSALWLVLHRLFDRELLMMLGSRSKKIAHQDG